MWSRSIRSSGDEAHLPSPERANLPNRRGREAPRGGDGPEATPPGLLVAEARAQVTQVPVQGFSTPPETGSGQEWGCHGLKSDRSQSPKSTSTWNLMWPYVDTVLAVLR